VTPVFTFISCIRQFASQESNDNRIHVFNAQTFCRRLASEVTVLEQGCATIQQSQAKCTSPDCSTGHNWMWEALWGRQVAGHSRKIGNTLLKSGPFHEPQNFSSRATRCRPLS